MSNLLKTPNANFGKFVNHHPKAGAHLVTNREHPNQYGVSTKDINLRKYHWQQTESGCQLLSTTNLQKARTLKAADSLAEVETSGKSTSNASNGSSRWQHLTHVLVSTPGLVLLVAIYAVMGAVIFSELEADKQTDNKTALIAKSREDCLKELWIITEKLNVLYERNWTILVEEQLQRFEGIIIAASHRNRYDPTNRNIEIDNNQIHKGAVQYAKVLNHWNAFEAYNLNNYVSNWSFGEALLYSITIITTIGHGASMPRTVGGKIATMFYAIVGVPLMLMCLTSLGTLLGHLLQRIYNRLCNHLDCCTFADIDNKKSTQHSTTSNCKTNISNAKVGLEPALPIDSNYLCHKCTVNLEADGCDGRQYDALNTDSCNLSSFYNCKTHIANDYADMRPIAAIQLQSAQHTVRAATASSQLTAASSSVYVGSQASVQNQGVLLTSTSSQQQQQQQRLLEYCQSNTVITSMNNELLTTAAPSYVACCSSSQALHYFYANSTLIPTCQNSTAISIAPLTRNTITTTAEAVRAAAAVVAATATTTTAMTTTTTRTTLSEIITTNQSVCCSQILKQFVNSSMPTMSLPVISITENCLTTECQTAQRTLTSSNKSPHVISTATDFNGRPNAYPSNYSNCTTLSSLQYIEQQSLMSHPGTYNTPLMSNKTSALTITSVSEQPIIKYANLQMATTTTAPACCEKLLAADLVNHESISQDILTPTSTQPRPSSLVNQNNRNHTKSSQGIRRVQFLITPISRKINCICDSPQQADITPQLQEQQQEPQHRSVDVNQPQGYNSMTTAKKLTTATSGLLEGRGHSGHNHSTHSRNCSATKAASYCHVRDDGNEFTDAEAAAVGATDGSAWNTNILPQSVTMLTAQTPSICDRKLPPTSTELLSSLYANHNPTSTFTNNNNNNNNTTRSHSDSNHCQGQNKQKYPQQMANLRSTCSLNIGCTCKNYLEHPTKATTRTTATTTTIENLPNINNQCNSRIVPKELNINSDTNGFADGNIYSNSFDNHYNSSNSNKDNDYTDDDYYYDQDADEDNDYYPCNNDEQCNEIDTVFNGTPTRLPLLSAAGGDMDSAATKQMQLTTTVQSEDGMVYQVPQKKCQTTTNNNFELDAMITQSGAQNLTYHCPCQAKFTEEEQTTNTTRYCTNNSSYCEDCRCECQIGDSVVQTLKENQVASNEVSVTKLKEPQNDNCLNYVEKNVEASDVFSKKENTQLHFTEMRAEIKPIQLPITVVVLIFITYLMLGTLILAIWENWSLIDGIYFCFVTLTTIGYGDLLPQQTLHGSHIELIAYCAYLLLGLILLAMFFNILEAQVFGKCKRFQMNAVELDKELQPNYN